MDAGVRVPGTGPAGDLRKKNPPQNETNAIVFLRWYLGVPTDAFFIDVCLVRFGTEF